ncbi:MAG: phage tail tape measure C-terminal domain-containing protein [Pseudomonadota bacterium]
MAEKRVSVRLAAVGGRQVRAELEGVGAAGERGFGRLSREMEAANRRLAGFARAARTGARIGAAAAAGGAIAMVRSSLQAVDAQAKLAQSLGTTVQSVQILERAGALAGVAMSGVEQATKDLTRRLSQAASGTGPAADALARLSLSAEDLLALPLDERVGRINAAIEAFVPAAERAAVAGQLFGEEGSIAMSRIDSATLRQATADIRDFGVAVSEADAAQIERTNDALSRLGLIWRGLSNQLTAAAAPALETVADAMAGLSRVGGPLNTAMTAVFANLERLAAIAAAFAGFMAGRWLAALGAAALTVRGLATALVVLRGALIRTGIGALIVGAGELIYQFSRLVRGAGGFGEAMRRLGDVARGVWAGIGNTLDAWRDGFAAMGEDVEAIWLRLMRFLQEKWAAFLARIAPSFNALPERLRGGLELDPLGAAAAASAYDGAILRAERDAEGLRASEAATLATAFDAAREAVAALRAAMRGSEEEGAEGPAGAQAAAERLETALEGAKTAAKGVAADAGEASREAARGWDAVTESLSRYAEATADLGQGLGRSLSGAFRSAEQAFGDFVKRGKVDFRDLASSILADLARLSARRFLLGPLANALSGALGGLFGSTAPLTSPLPAPRPVLHAGGLVGGPAPQRLVPDMVFADAPRMHAGGVAGLRPDEVPAILQRGERVLSRRETAAYGREGAAPSVTVNIVASDVESFRRSRTQVAADLARAVAFGRRGM